MDRDGETKDGEIDSVSTPEERRANPDDDQNDDIDVSQRT